MASRGTAVGRHTSDVRLGTERFKIGSDIQLSMNLDMKDKALLEKVLQENTDANIRRKLIEKYTKYYRYWVDFNILTAVLAGLGLILGMYQWETEFMNRGPDGIDAGEMGIVPNLIIALLSAIALCSIFIKYRLQAVWRNYRNPVAFFKKIVKKQIEMGLVDEEEISHENYKDENSTLWVLSNPWFWFEVLLISVFPYPIREGRGLLNPYFYEDATNWVDNSGSDNPGQATIYKVPYLMSDVFLAIMFLRFYFIIQGLIVLSPVNRLYGKRICFDRGFEPNFAFQLKGAFKLYPYLTFAVMSLVSVTSFALVIRIFERPYFTYTLHDADGNRIVFENFQTFGDAFWFVIISMTTVGYGGVIATTPRGRQLALCSVAIGAFLLSVLVAIITEWFILSENQDKAIAKITTNRKAGVALRTAFQYNVARAKRYRLLTDGNEEGEHVPT